jgi:monofunctional biosynthetic peptidoglycan transglycosylase
MDTHMRFRITPGNIIKLILALLVIYAVWQYVDLPGPAIISLQEGDPGKSALMRLRMSEADDDKPLEYEYVPIDKISPHFVRAVLAVEDGGFYRHHGIDWRALENAYKRNERAGRVRFGGSTITMQLAKNLFLSNDRSYLRKVKEAVITFRLERYLSKKRILELYLNIIELGDRIFGVEAASRHYFKKSASQLSSGEAASLAAIIASPLKHSPTESSRFMGIRRGTIRRKTGM